EGEALVVAVAAVNVVAEHDEAAVMVLQLVARQEVLLAGLDAPLVVGDQFQEGRSLAVAGRGKDEIVLDDGGRDGGGRVGDLLGVPQELAGLGVDADQAELLVEQGDVLANATDAGDDDGGIAGAGVDRDRALPDDGAGGLVEGEEGRVLAAGSADELV